MPGQRTPTKHKAGRKPMMYRWGLLIIVAHGVKNTILHVLFNPTSICTDRKSSPDQDGNLVLKQTWKSSPRTRVGRNTRLYDDCILCRPANFGCKYMPPIIFCKAYVPRNNLLDQNYLMTVISNTFISHICSKGDNRVMGCNPILDSRRGNNNSF